MKMTAILDCHRDDNMKKSILRVGLLLMIILINFHFIFFDFVTPAGTFNYEMVENGLISARERKDLNEAQVTDIRSFDINDQHVIINAGDKIALLNITTLDLVKIINEVTFPNGSVRNVRELGALERIRFDVDGTFYVTASLKRNVSNSEDEYSWFAYHLSVDCSILHFINLTALQVKYPGDILPHKPYLIVKDVIFSESSTYDQNVYYTHSRLMYININETPLQLHKFPINIPRVITSYLELNDNNILYVKFNAITRTSQTPDGFGILFFMNVVNENRDSLYSSYFIQLYDVPSVDEDSNPPPNTSNNNVSSHFSLTTEYRINSNIKPPPGLAFNLWNVYNFDIDGNDAAIMSYFGKVYVVSLRQANENPLIGIVDVLASKPVNGNEDGISISEIKVEKNGSRIFMLDAEFSQCIYVITITDLTPENFLLEDGNDSNDTDDDPWVKILPVILILLFPLDFTFRHPIETAIVVILTVTSFIVVKRIRKRTRNIRTSNQKEDVLEFGGEMNDEISASLTAHSSETVTRDSKNNDEEF